MKEVKRTLETYNEMAELYAEKFNSMTLYEVAFEQLASLLPETARVLDVGCGPATAAIQLLRYKADAKITGIDGAPNMIAKAKSLLPVHDWRVLRFDELSALQGLFDGVIASFCWPYLLPLQTHPFIKNLNRVCAPGGTLLLSFVPGMPDEELIQTNHQGQSVYFRKDTLEKVELTLKSNAFYKLQQFNFPFPGKTGVEEHIFILAKKA